MRLELGESFTDVLKIRWIKNGNLPMPIKPDSFCEILALNYAPGAAAPGTAVPGTWTIWSNILQEHIWMQNAPGTYSKYAPGAYLKCTMLQEHV